MTTLADSAAGITAAPAGAGSPDTTQPVRYRYLGSLHVEPVADEGVFLLGEEGGAVRIAGSVISAIDPLLRDSGATLAELRSAVGTVPSDRLDAALDALIRRGVVTTAPADEERRLWEHRASADDSSALLTDTRVVVATTDPAAVGDLPEALTDAGFGGVAISEWISPDPDAITVYCVEDYQDPRLDAINRSALQSGARWYLTKPAGKSGWFGPLFDPQEETPCWGCLEIRLNSNRLIRNYLVQRNGSFVPAPASSRLSRSLGARIAAQHLADLVTTNESAREIDIVTFDYLDISTIRHPVDKRPQCSVCGDPGLQAALQNQPVRIVRRQKVGDGDGGDRAVRAEDLVNRFTPRISPITGIIKQLTPMPSAPGLHAYQSGQNFAITMSAVTHLRSGLRSAAAGKGRSAIQAKASAIGEAIERSSGRFFGDEARIRCRADELDEKPIMPNEIALYSDRQIERRAEWNAREIGFQAVCDPFDSSTAIDWTPVWSLTSNSFRYAPTANLFYSYPYVPGHRYAAGDSNGCAAGASLEDAVLQGFFELVERDSVAIWWYNMLRRPSIDLDSFDNPYFDVWRRRYRTQNRETWVLDLTTDLEIPAVVAISRRTDKRHEDILMAFGAHFDVETAISRAMTEMNQFLPAVIGSLTDDDGYSYNDPEQVHWWRTATLANQPYLAPGETVRTSAEFPRRAASSLDEDVHEARRRVEAAGMQFLVLDQTRPDAGLPVARVLVPGMRHFWTRFGPGRLYDVPVAAGDLSVPTPEEQLNPIGMFL